MQRTSIHVIARGYFLFGILKVNQNSGSQLLNLFCDLYFGQYFVYQVSLVDYNYEPNN